MKYKILPGNSFRDTDGSVKTGGELIDLDEDAARIHADKVEPVAVASSPDAAPDAFTEAGQ
jgi:hypothetical protein